jgi:prepilin signal peptidase PulO-like enzyme (type II secretory pathway)
MVILFFLTAILGLTVGSSLNVVTHRVLHRASVLAPRSALSGLWAARRSVARTHSLN